jgi:membrane protein YqaA with SNARE-associated domain
MSSARVRPWIAPFPARHRRQNSSRRAGLYSVAPAAEASVASIAFIESSIFLIPADVLFVPMALPKPAMAYRYALTAILASSFDGIAGYYLGHYARKT